MKKKLMISFSGGRTSAVMTKLCWEQYKEEFDIAVCYANTGLEHENTLVFIQQVADNWGIPVVWVEAIVNPKEGKGITSKIVNFETADRKGTPMEEAIKKHGIPNVVNPHCSGRLKQEVVYHYARKHLGWKANSWYTAIGFRADEIDRISENAKKNKVIYPLIQLGFTERAVDEYMEKEDFNLVLPGKHWGNCITCWKKSFRKLCTIAKEDEKQFDFFNRMEKKYGDVKNKDGYDEKVFFRKKKSTEDVLEMAKEPFKLYKDRAGRYELFPPSEDLSEWEFWDKESSCSETCEIEL